MINRINMLIFGYGTVGQAVHSLFMNDSVNIKIIDPKYREYATHTSDDIIEADVVFVCVDTDNLVDVNNNVNKVLKNLESFRFNGLVILKSTIHPKYLLEFNLKIVSNPEFLKERSAYEDIKNEPLILGGLYSLCFQAYNVYNIYSSKIINKNELKFMKFKDALILKYLYNIKLSYDIIFKEFMADMTDDYRKFNDILDIISPRNVIPCADGKRGIGGHCLPKDIKAFPKHDLTEFLMKYTRKDKK